MDAFFKNEFAASIKKGRDTPKINVLFYFLVLNVAEWLLVIKTFFKQKMQIIDKVIYIHWVIFMTTLIVAVLHWCQCPHPTYERPIWYVENPVQVILKINKQPLNSLKGDNSFVLLIIASCKCVYCLELFLRWALWPMGLLLLDYLKFLYIPNFVAAGVTR